MNLKHRIQSCFHDYYKKLEAREHQLSYLFLEITRRCNLNCLHCGSDCSSSTRSPELTTESWQKIISYFYRHFSTSVTFIITGGEPLVHPDLFEITRHINKHNMRWGMVTNGMALNQNRMKQLVNTGIYSITLSLDGTEKNHNKIRNNPNAFKQILQALDNTGKADIPVKDAVSCIFPGNLNELDQIAQLLIDKGITSWRLFRIFPSGRAANNNELMLSFEQTQQMLRWIKENKKFYKKKGLDINLSCEGWLPFDTDKKVRDFPFFCRAGINIASILCDGTITGCSNNDPVFYEGNILKEDFINVWENKFLKFRDKSWVKNTDCANCEHLNKCQGNSIHLWHGTETRPRFCYVKDLSKID